MSISFYTASVAAYQQVLDGLAEIMNKGAVFAEEQNIALDDVVQKRMREDMMPFHFQIVSVCHHSWGAMQGMQAGEFSPPSFALDKSYAQLQELVTQAQTGLASLSEAEVDGFADKSLVFKLGEREMPFTNENFLLSFSLPNFYFHATTAYDILRMLGTPLGKMDFLGRLRVGV